jgi:hypothetical protein
VNPRETLRHWGLVVWQIAVGVNLLATLVVRSSVTSGASGDLAAVENAIRHAALTQEVSLALRIVSTAALLVGILGLRGRVATRLEAAESHRRSPLLQESIAP